MPELEFHLARVLRVDSAVGKDGHGWPVVSDCPAEDDLGVRAVAVDAPDGHVNLAMRARRSLPRYGGPAGA